MNRWNPFCVLFTALVLLPARFTLAAAPIALHPDNPHYFLWRGKATALVTSAEHYGAVMNLDFDYRRYLQTQRKAGMNYTRIFSGSYVEPEGAFNIARNTLAPLPGRFLAPWARSEQPGYANGGNKFDLTRWDDRYFARLKDFVGRAARSGVVVELSLFCPMYEDSQWRLSPMNPANHVNGWGAVPRTNVYTLDRHGGLLAVQESLVRKLVTELNGFDNLFYEICNEPYFGGVTLAWQHHIADVIVATEGGLPHRHLIAQNIANHSAKVENPHPSVSILNFHYATPPKTVALNYSLNRVIGDDETGFRGTNNVAYRSEAWEFLLAGGGLFNNLDYSFTAGHEDGTFVYPQKQPGGGNPDFRQQMRILSRFLHELDFVRMRPDVTVVEGGVPAGGAVQALVEPGRTIAVYLRREGAAVEAQELKLRLPEGTWRAEWIDTKTGRITGRSRVEGGGVRSLMSPPYHEDIALRLRRR
ncbi:MAG: hypothetical protein JNK85_19800 [Verrucomicrobiales bacterium]|nr:hypothetical protein [Verrucomicrobiales bacterium]